MAFTYTGTQFRNPVQTRFHSVPQTRFHFSGTQFYLGRGHKLGSTRFLGTQLEPSYLGDLEIPTPGDRPAHPPRRQNLLQNPSPNSKKFFQILFLKKDASIENHGTGAGRSEQKG